MIDVILQHFTKFYLINYEAELTYVKVRTETK